MIVCLQQILEEHDFKEEDFGLFQLAGQRCIEDGYINQLLEIIQDEKNKVNPGFLSTPQTGIIHCCHYPFRKGMIYCVITHLGNNIVVITHLGREIHCCSYPVVHPLSYFSTVMREQDHVSDFLREGTVTGAYRFRG